MQMYHNTFQIGISAMNKSKLFSFQINLLCFVIGLYSSVICVAPEAVPAEVSSSDKIS